MKHRHLASTSYVGPEIDLKASVNVKSQWGLVLAHPIVMFIVGVLRLRALLFGVTSCFKRLVILSGSYDVMSVVYDDCDDYDGSNDYYIHRL